MKYTFQSTKIAALAVSAALLFSSNSAHAAIAPTAPPVKALLVCEVINNPSSGSDWMYVKTYYEGVLVTQASGDGPAHTTDACLRVRRDVCEVLMYYHTKLVNGNIVTPIIDLEVRATTFGVYQNFHKTCNPTEAN